MTFSEKKTESKYFACSCKHAKGSIIYPVVTNRLQVSHDIHNATAKPLSCCYYANTLVSLQDRGGGVINTLYIPHS